MPRFAPALALALLLPAAGCTFEGRTDGGSPLHTDNGALEAHRQAVEEAASPEVVEPLGSAPTPSASPVPTPRLGTVAQGEGAAANSGALATPPVPVPGGGQTPAGTRTGNTGEPIGQ